MSGSLEQKMMVSGELAGGDVSGGEETTVGEISWEMVIIVVVVVMVMRWRWRRSWE